MSFVHRKMRIVVERMLQAKPHTAILHCPEAFFQMCPRSAEVTVSSIQSGPPEERLTNEAREPQCLVARQTFRQEQSRVRIVMTRIGGNHPKATETGGHDEVIVDRPRLEDVLEERLHADVILLNACNEAARQQSVGEDRKSTRLNSSHPSISYAVFCLKKKK